MNINIINFEKAGILFILFQNEQTRLDFIYFSLIEKNVK